MKKDIRDQFEKEFKEDIIKKTVSEYINWNYVSWLEDRVLELEDALSSEVGGIEVV
jgi:hypothetical protein